MVVTGMCLGILIGVSYTVGAFALIEAMKE